MSASELVEESVSEEQDDDDNDGGDSPPVLGELPPDGDEVDSVEEVINFLNQRHRRPPVVANDDSNDDDDDDDDDSTPLFHRALSLVLAMDPSSFSMNNFPTSDGTINNDDDVDNNNNDNGGMEDSNNPQPLPREHSYLDASHPLLPEENVPYYCNQHQRRHHHQWKRPRSEDVGPDNNNNSSSTNDRPTSIPPFNDSTKNVSSAESSSTSSLSFPPSQRHSLIELAVLELPGVVLFPGQTIPVKVRDRSMIQYIGRQIRLCRTHPDLQPQVQLGILPHEEEVVVEERRRPSNDGGTTRRGGDDISTIRRRRQQQQQQLNRRESLLMRQSFSDSYTVQHNRQRMRAFMLRTGLLFQDDDDDNDDDDDRVAQNDDVGGTTTTTTTSTTMSTNGPGSQPQPPRYQHPFVGRIGTIATVKQTHERVIGPPIVGTSTLSSTSGGNNTSQRTDSSTGLWGRYDDATELVFTAVGVSRFRIVGCVDDADNDHVGNIMRGGRRDSSTSNIFIVEDLNDRPVPRPPLNRPFASVPWLKGPHVDIVGPDTDNPRESNDGRNGNDGRDDGLEVTAHNEVLTTSLLRQSQLAWNLSQLTPVPYFIYQNLSPWSMVDKILRLLQSNNGRGNLPALGDVEKKNLDPMRFSFWMANNAPFTENERLELLKIHSVLERLIVIWKAVEQLSKQESFICCSQCKTRFTKVTDIFTVGGADGTTATYVNNYGTIHQITTMRTIDEGKVVFEGRPSTHNSYFPGYSWHIIYCRRCASHLGWKFRMVPRASRSLSSASSSSQGSNRGGVDGDRPDRPKFFYGFMASTVTTAQS